MPHVLYIASECAPFAKSGGLGDVLGALPQAAVRQGIQAAVILPLYRQVEEVWKTKMSFLGSATVSLSWRKQYAGLYRLEREGVTYYFVDNKYYFDRDVLYGSFDDGERFAFFSKAVLELLPMLDDFPDVLHCNDWQSALVPVYLKTEYHRRKAFHKLRTLFTIHNIEYQGKYDHCMLGDVLGLSNVHKNLMDLGGGLNYMKAALVCCDWITTVSPTYAREILYPFFGRGLETVIRDEQAKLLGILNGIDTVLYDPETDAHLPVNFNAKTKSLKDVVKEALCRELGLSYRKGRPLIGMVTRLTQHKGLDLVSGIFDEMMAQDLDLVLLGTGEAKYESRFRLMAARYPERFSFVTAFSGPLASRIYGGSDFFLMPSISEPCGLSQMIALRYGTVPIVRKTGGLADSIQPFSTESGLGNGVTFETINAHDMMDAIRRGLSYYQNPILWDTLTDNAFASDNSWDQSAGEYLKLYNQLTQQ